MFIIKKSSVAAQIKAGVGGVMLWYGIRSDIPEHYAEYDPASEVFVKGGSSQNTTPTGANIHSHQLTALETSSISSHSHSISNAAVASTGSKVIGGSGAPTLAADEVHDHAVTAMSISSAGAHVHTVSSPNTADHKPPYYQLYWIKRTSYDRDSINNVPIGGIVMWKGAIASAPSGFYICDGETYNGYKTPDLRDRFIYGADYDEQVDGVGGAETHSHTIPNTSNVSHSHTVGGTSGAASASAIIYDTGLYYAARASHTHALSGSTGSKSHGHAIPDSSSEAHEPPYVMLYFIMRTV